MARINEMNGEGAHPICPPTPAIPVKIIAFPLQRRIHRFALQRQDAEYAFVDPAQGLAAYKAFQRFDAQSELPPGQRPLSPETALPQTLQVFRLVVIGAVNDAQVFAAPALDGRLHQAPIRLSPTKPR